MVVKTEGPADGYIDIKFNDKQVLNRIDLSLHTIKSATVYIEFTLDELNYFHLPYYPDGKQTGIMYLLFPTTEMKNMRIWIRKQESDKEIVHPEGYSYQYLFGVKNSIFPIKLSRKRRGCYKISTPKQMRHSLLGKYHWLQKKRFRTVRISSTLYE